MAKRYTLKEIAKYLKIAYEGEDKTVTAIHTLDQAAAQHLSFFNDRRYLQSLRNTHAGAVLVESAYAHEVPSHSVALVTDEPYVKLALATKLFAYVPSVDSQPPRMGEGCRIDSSVRFGKGVKLGDNVTVMAGCYLGDNVEVGDGTLLYPNVTLYHATQVGKDCIIHSGTVIGSDGYGFARTKEGGHVKIYQNGNVVIGDGVEIGANCAIDRAAFGSTRIGSGTKIDNLIQIAHNCEIGRNVLIAAQTGLSGTTKVGDNVMMGGQSGTAGHLSIGEYAVIYAKAGVTKSLEGGKVYAGFPAVEMRLWRKIQAVLSRLAKKR